MEDIEIPILSRSSAEDFEQFIKFWSNLYDYPNMEDYTLNIKYAQGEKYKEDNIWKLYRWRGRYSKSESKELTVKDKIIDRIDEINKLKSQKDIDLDQFFEQFDEISAVWAIFLLHILKPLKYPLYDQHIHRAFNYMHKMQYKCISNHLSDSAKIRFYKKYYLPFIHAMMDKYPTLSVKQIDNGLFAFGRLLNLYQYDRMF